MMALESWSFFKEAGDTEPPELLTEETETVKRNLDLLAEEKALLSRRRVLQLSELAALLSLPEYAPFREELSDFTETILCGDSSSEDTVLFARELVRRGFPLSRTGHADDLFGNGEPISQKASDRVAYLRSRVTDDAFRLLTAHLENPKAAYFSSFSDVCEEVYHGLCEYCILPIESSDNGKLLSFYTLIEKFELRIVAVTDLDGAGPSYTRYALLRHKYVSPDLIGLSSEARYAEFALELSEHVSLTDVLSAAEFLGLKVSRADSMPIPERRDLYRYGLVFLLPSDGDPLPSLEAFLLYLSLSLPEYIPLGIYTKI